MLNGHTLFVSQIIAHISLIFLMITGSRTEWTVAIFVYFMNGCIGMTATYHRLISHKSWECPKVIEYFGALCATIGLTGSAISWVAIHRKHHRYTDLDGDPHAPSKKGFIYCHWFSMFEHVEVRYVLDIIKEPFYVFQHRYYFLINSLYAFLLCCFDPRALIYAWLAPACILWNAGSSIVTLSHLFGANPNRLDSHARNIPLLGFLVWGEGWHNNHHHAPKSANFSRALFQIDIGYWYILFVKKIIFIYENILMFRKSSKKIN